MTEKTMLTFTAGTRKREELYVERIYYIAVDPLNPNSWINVLGIRAFSAWLQLQTLVDRSQDAESRYGNLSTVPRSIKSLAATLGMSNKTLYDKVLKILWNYGFIDFVEWADQKKYGQKAINIIVYPYPQNNIELQFKPLELCRNYDTDYSSSAKTYNNASNRKQRKDKQVRLDLSETTYEAKMAHDLLLERLKDLGIKQRILDEVAYELYEYPDVIIPFQIAEAQLLHMEQRVNQNKIIYDFAKYFVGGAVSRTETLESVIDAKTIIDEYNEQKRLLNARKVPGFYNWLDERE